MSNLLLLFIQMFIEPEGSSSHENYKQHIYLNKSILQVKNI